MDWKIDYLQESGIVHVKMLDSVKDLEGIKQLTIEATAAGREHKSHKYLIDHRGLGIVLSVPDIDRFPDIFREAEADLEGKIAILVDTSAPGIDRVEFLRDVLSKAWMHLEIFTGENKAIAWLKTV